MTFLQLCSNFKNDAILPGGVGLLSLSSLFPGSCPRSGSNHQDAAKAGSSSANLGFIQVLQINVLKLGVKYSFLLDHTRAAVTDLGAVSPV